MKSPYPPLKPLRNYIPRKQILGMEPWMFWTLLAVTVFALVGLELVWLIRKL